MISERKSYVLFGISGYKALIDTILKDYQIEKDNFEIRLILTEALTNAFKHGNKSDEKASISLQIYFDGEFLEMEIVDSEKNKDMVIIPDSILEDKILDVGGRGLFLINSIADMVEYQKNKLVIKKRLTI